MTRRYKKPPEADYFFATLNSMGYMLTAPESLMQAFITYAEKTQGQVLDIGAAYGITSIPAALAGAKVTANDLDPRHLDILWEEAPEAARKNLTLVQGRMPSELNFEAGQFDAILASRIFTFLPPETIPDCFERVARWLKPGGKFFYLGGTPNMKDFASFWPQYQKNLAAGAEWPGFIQDVASVCPEKANQLPASMNLLSEQQVLSLLARVGLHVEHAEYVSTTPKMGEQESFSAISVKK